jgi:hypothetical protein
VVAQTVAGWKKPEGPAPQWLKADAERLARIDETRKAMSAKVTYDFNGTPLREALEQLGRQLNVSFVINDIELDNAGQTGDVPITAHGTDVRLIDAKEQILKPLDLNWRAGESYIEISSSVDVASEPSLMIYDLAYKSQEAVDLESLSGVIASSIDPDEWQDYGGTGCSTIMPFGSALVISTPDDTQTRIGQFLSQLNKFPVRSSTIQQRQPPTGLTGIVSGIAITVTARQESQSLPAGRVTLPQGRNYVLIRYVENKPGTENSGETAADKSVRKWAPPKSSQPFWINSSSAAEREKVGAKLREPIALDVAGVSLEVALTKLLGSAEVPFWIDHLELDNAGQSADVPVTLKTSGSSLHDVLSRVLKPLDLAYRIEAQRLEITSSDDAENHFTERVYDMAYLSEKPIDMEQLIRVIATSVDHDEWAAFGGTGDSVIVASGSQLFVAAPDSTRIKLESFLHRLTLLHPDNLPPGKPTHADNYVEVFVQDVPGGSTIDIPSEGIYRLKLAN